MSESMYRGQSDFKDVKLYLDRSRRARAFPKPESFWEPEITRIMDLIESQSEAVRSKRRDEEKPYLSIAIFGTYGSGKSSLLRTLVQRIKESSIRESLNISSLPVIEPNILNKQDHFLYSFLATALEVHHQKFKEKNRGSDESQVLTHVQKSFLSLSEHLKVIDDQVDQREFDPHEISMSRLERHTSGVSLKNKMATFLDKLIDDLAGPSSLLLMPVDDADMSMDELISTLDTLTRYLHYPRLVPVFTFTGRLAEELLRVNYGEKLHIDRQRSNDSKHDKLQELASSIDITESLALQYLGKLFPVRNRIRLGFAAARAQASKYVGMVQGRNKIEQSEEKSQHVMVLLETASNLLFGFSNWPMEARIGAALRAATLRRQVQIIDALHAADVQFFDPDDGDAHRAIKDLDESRFNLDLILERRVPSWVNIFDGATWALLNVHRDILREFRLNLDDLYSWTPISLRQVILDSILSKPLKLRQKIFRMWKFKSEDRRSQMLSLMAANIFRPRMLVEETTGDDPNQIRLRQKINKDIGDEQYRKLVVRALTTSISTREGALWFLNLWTGFYLPQTLFVDEIENNVDESNSVGWDLESGPTIAIQEMLSRNLNAIPGAIRVDYAQFKDVLNELNDEEKTDNRITSNQYKVNKNSDSCKDKTGKENAHSLVNNLKDFLLMNIWCYLDFEKGKPCAVLSLWRGLGLIGQILRVDIEMRASYLLDKPYDNPEKRKERVKTVIKNHFRHVLTPERGGVFQHWYFEGSFKTILDILTEDILDWLDSFDPEFQRIYPLWSAEVRSDEEDIRERVFEKRAKVLEEKLHNTIKTSNETLKNFMKWNESLEKKQKLNPCVSEYNKVIQEKYEHSKETKERPNIIEELEKIKEILESKLKLYDQKIFRLEQKISKEYNDLSGEDKKEIEQLFEDLKTSKSNRNRYFSLCTSYTDALRTYHKINRLEASRIIDFPDKDPSLGEDVIEFQKKQLNWESCFIRRLHGHELLGKFLKDLESALYNLQSNKENNHAYGILKQWCSALIGYWDCGSKWRHRKEENNEEFEFRKTKREPKIVTLLATCPFLRPFSEYSLIKELKHIDRPNFGLVEFDAKRFKKIKLFIDDKT